MLLWLKVVKALHTANHHVIRRGRLKYKHAGRSCYNAQLCVAAVLLGLGKYSENLCDRSVGAIAGTECLSI